MNNSCCILNISPIDGRYNKLTKELNFIFSEYSFIKQRVIIEIQYFLFLLKLNTPAFPNNDKLKWFMINLSENISIHHTTCIKNIEKKIHHDVKSIEYFLTNQLKKEGFDKYINLLHFGLTSQDVNTIAYSISLHKFKNDIFSPLFEILLEKLQNKINDWNNTVIVGRTHGQPATWTILGKEFMVFKNKLLREYNILSNYKITTKIGGCVGNMTSHKMFAPHENWETLLTEFASQFDLQRTKYTTQIHNYDEFAFFFDILKRICAILIDMCRDIWLYCALGELTLDKPKEHIGSSVMPHKVNPIEFENAEGNLKITEMWLEFLSRELLKSRLQRDLTDSTILRNLGTVFGHMLISLKNINRGFTFLKENKKKIEMNLLENVSSMSEVDQHSLRINNECNGYDTRKNHGHDICNNKVEYYKQFILTDSI
jgi:adenylosuccinate lyase